MDIPPNLGYGDQQQTKHSKTSPFVRNPTVMVRRHISIFTDLKETAVFASSPKFLTAKFGISGRAWTKDDNLLEKFKFSSTLPTPHSGPQRWTQTES